MAEFDSLTGLPNRALFMDRLSTALIRAARSKRAVAVMFIDLDGFKAVNDTHGHAAGDELLKEVARRLEAAVRKSDTVARLAGDEFTVILEELINPAVDAQRLATKLVETLRRPVVSGDIALRVTASIGLVVHDPELKPDIDAAQLLREADGAMYAAKRAGKDAVVRFELDAPVTRIAH
jgi:diguanylate cyclase (GGDEF)-like protein